MQIKKGKVLFGYKDTWNMNGVLSKVICAGLVKYKETINVGEDRKGIPASISCYLVEQGEITYEDGFSLSDEDWDKCYNYFDYVLDEMIYAFADNEPDISDYNFSHNFIHEEAEKGSCCIPVTIECTNQAESDRHTKDCKEHQVRCEEGRMLFAKHFDGLWW